MISPVKRNGNSDGRSLYCDRRCYMEWSPGLNNVYNHYRSIMVEYKSLNPKEFMCCLLRMIYEKYPTWTVRANVLRVSRGSFRSWCKKFGVRE